MFAQLPPLKSLRAFESAARHQSFTTAARELCLTQGAVSYQIKLLESKLGTPLFYRGVRQVSLTAAGERLFRITHRILKDLQDEVSSISPKYAPMTLTISVSTFFATRWLSKHLGDFLFQHSEVALNMQHSVNDPNFNLEDVDLAIRWGRGNWPDAESELILASPMIAVCSPSLVNGPNPIRTLDDLKQHIFLHDQPGNDGWREWLAKAGLDALGEGKGPVILDPNVRVQSAIDGHGLLLGNYLLEDEIKQNLLVAPFDIQLEGLGFHLLYTKVRRRRKAFTLFRQWLLNCLQQNSD